MYIYLPPFVCVRVCVCVCVCPLVFIAYVEYLECLGRNFKGRNYICEIPQFS